MNLILILALKDIWVKEILLLEVWVRGGGEGSTPTIQGMDSYPVN